MSLTDKRAKVLLGLSEVEKVLNLPGDIHVARVVSHDDPPGLTVHIVSEGFAEVVKDSESPILTIRALFSESVNEIQARGAGEY